jgi:hypothetical protein
VCCLFAKKLIKGRYYNCFKYLRQKMEKNDHVLPTTDQTNWFLKKIAENRSKSPKLVIITLIPGWLLLQLLHRLDVVRHRAEGQPEHLLQGEGRRGRLAVHGVPVIRDRFYKAWFRPKKFRDKLVSYILGLIFVRKQQTVAYLTIYY